MIDLHAHVLPGLDDGPANLAEALALLAAMATAGIAVVVASPHCDEERYRITAEQVRSAVDDLTVHARASGLAIRILPGMELTLTPTLVQRLHRGEALGIAGSRYICVELPHTQYPRYTEAGTFALLSRGYQPVLNHPERNLGIQEQPQRFERLSKQGVHGMVTAGSLTGSFGPAAQRLAERFLREGLADLVVTDAHDSRRRRPDLGTALALARGLGKHDQFAEQAVLATCGLLP